ncbi:tetratricopeptide repeat (TPR)-like superfamily protein [Wolffia australiana]
MAEEGELGETLAMAEALSIQEQASISYPLSPAVFFTSASDLCFDLDSFDELAARGQWRTVLDKIESLRPNLPSAPPHQRFVFLAIAVLALFKLRRYADAARELQSIDLDLDLDLDLDSSVANFESYPEIYPNRSGSMIPFCLRFFHAELPLRLNGDRSETLDRLYALLDLARRKLGGRSDRLWRRREAFVVGSLCRHHFSKGEFDLCLLLIRDLLSKNPRNPILLSRLGYVQLQIGDLDGANSTFDRVEMICEDRELNLVGRNRALRMIAGKDYRGALREYEACIERDAGDVVAINNKALCLMYSRDLSDSIKVLEGALERVPTAAVNETAVVNLCSMYELAFANHVEIKKNLNSWIARVAPDDFDSSCTRI